MAPKLPTLEEILRGIGVDYDALVNELRALAAKYPDGKVPLELIEHTLTQFIGGTKLKEVMQAIGIALLSLVKKGKGPVGKSDVELV